MTELTDDERKVLIRMLNLSGAGGTPTEYEAQLLIEEMTQGWCENEINDYWEISDKWFDSFGETWDYPAMVQALMNKEQPKSDEESGAIDCGGFDWLYQSSPTETPLTETLRTGERREINSQSFYLHDWRQQHNAPDPISGIKYMSKEWPDICKVLNEYLADLYDKEPKSQYQPAPASFARQLSVITEVDPFPRIGWPGRPKE